jgi:GNAT superfamily N-acetyltransferase
MQFLLTPDPDFPVPLGVQLRILGKDDISLLVDHLKSLDEASLRDRFNGITSPGWVEDYARSCIRPGTMVLAAEAEGSVIGVAELHPAGGDSAELAFSVLAPWRGKGVGAALFSLIVEAAWSRGLDSIEITTHSGNDAMKKLARRFGTELRFETGETFGRISLAEMHMLDQFGNKRSWTPQAQSRRNSHKREATTRKAD